MQQYLDLLKKIVTDGTRKDPAREGMPSSLSLFGYQFRHNLEDGFPLLTTKKMFWKGIVTELLWILNGDTNIKYLVDEGVNIWNEDAYNYYLKIRAEWLGKKPPYGPENLIIKRPLSLEDFITGVKSWKKEDKKLFNQDYRYGDLPHQYGATWRNFGALEQDVDEFNTTYFRDGVDQIANIIKSLKTNPEGRRHIVTAIDPTVEPALYWCHAMFQFNCRKIEYFEGDSIAYGEEGKFYRWRIKPTRENEGNYEWEPVDAKSMEEIEQDHLKYYLDCQMYQRSADVVLGVPFNIASYALLIHIIAEVCHMIPSEFIHTFGDVHIYSNHIEALNTQLKRNPTKLPKLKIENSVLHDLQKYGLDETLPFITYRDFELIDYNPQPAIKAELSTGLKK